MKIRLSISKPGQEEADIFDFDLAYCLVGRTNANLLLADGRCSSQHLLLFQGPDAQLWVRDLESTNGTFLNGKKISEATFKPGDELRVGKTVIRVLEYYPVKVHGAASPAHAVDEHEVPKQQGQQRELTQEGTQARDTKLLKRQPPKKLEGLINRWPDNLHAAPKDIQNKFVDYVDENGTRTRINLKNVRKVG